MVRVHEFQPGKYTSQAARVEDTDAGPPTAVNQSAQDLYVHGKLNISNLWTLMSSLAAALATM